MKKYDLTYDEYVAKQGEQMTYRRKVDVITNNQPLHTLENYDKRGLAGTVGAYHVDHIYPVSAGFKDGILPEIMGNIENLQMLP